MPPLDRNTLDRHDFVLMEAAIIERLRRESGVGLHPELVNAPLVHEEPARTAMARIYDEYLTIAAVAELPMLILTPTWRANQERIEAAGETRDLNGDGVRFLRGLRARREAGAPVWIGGQMGCRNDCYRPDEGLSAAAAERFHAWQVERLAAAEPDFLLAATLPAVAEATGIARAMARTGLPYLLSFVIGRDGRVLDGTTLADAVAAIDAAVDAPPQGYQVNCSYPTFLDGAAQPPGLFRRLIGFQANASALDQAALDGACELRAEPVAEWGGAMLRLRREFGLKLLGGCCGTGAAHLRYLIAHRREGG